MATAAAQLLSKVMRTGKLQEVLDFGISTDDFPSSQDKSMFERLVSEQQLRGGVIGTNLAAHLFPMFIPCDDEATSLEQLCHEVRKQRLAKEVKAACERATAMADMDPTRASTELEAVIRRHADMQMERKQALTFGKGMKLLTARYDLMKSGVITGKAAWPWLSMQHETRGLQEDDYVVFYGRPKSMKSFVLTYLIACAYNQGKRVLVYTKEMTDLNMMLRIAAFVGQLPYRETRLGELSAEHELVYRSLGAYVEEQYELTNGANDLKILSGEDVEQGGDTIQWLHRHVDKYKPDIVFIDGLYLMSDASAKKNAEQHVRVLNISRAARAMQLRTRIPLIATMQANRAAAKHSKADFDEIAYSDAIGQDVTAAIRVINEKDAPTIALVFAGSREFKMHGIRIAGEPCLPFHEICQLAEGDIEKAKAGDVAGTEPDEKKNLRTPRARKLPMDEAQKALQEQLRGL